MADTLLDGGRAAALYVQTLGFSRVQSYRAIQQVCASSTYNDNSRIICQGWDGNEPSATFIGTDGADIGYFRLSNIRTAWQEVYNTAACDGPSGNYYFTGYATTGRTVQIYDGGSDTAPYDGHTIIDHPGIPVCAARRRGPGQSAWLPFASGDATAATVAAARSACGVNDFFGDLGGALPPIEIEIKHEDPND